MKFQEMLSRIETGERFSIRFVKCSQQRRTGGERCELEGLRMIIKDQATPGKKQKPSKGKRPYHRGPQSITLFHEETGRYIRVNKRLITRFNNQEVVY